MADEAGEKPDRDLVPPEGLLASLRARTPARILAGRAGPAYRTSTWLQLREDHAAALDAVHAELDLACDFGTELVARWKLFEVRSQASSKEEYLLRPDLGRRLGPAARAEIVERCPAGAEVQVVIGDGLSAAAVIAQVPALLPMLAEELERRGLRMGQPFVVRHCRVGVMNDVGEVLQPAMVVLLIGERPGLAVADSLSAYLAYKPASHHADADRNLVSNIHARGVPVISAARRIANLCQRMLQAQTSGVQLKEEIAPCHVSGPAPADKLLY